ncbi:Pyrimidine nucleotide transporter, mitochondrial [Vanrija albida]|uniref:Pyrimidine nucleotide transporter, mitochondrial n=1 Tax=Vanrija albida TaxID=181172 RepID=A0ABR3PX39_9TREE
MSATPVQTSSPASSSHLVPPPSPKAKKQLVGWQHSVAGSLGGMAGAIVTSPFDVVKTRLQSDLFREPARAATAAVANGNGNGAAAVMRHEAEMVAKKVPHRGGISGSLWQFVDTMYLIRRIQVEEGWRALYKGLGPSLVGIIPARAINFYFYPTSKAFLAKTFPNAPTEKEGQTSEDSPLVHLGAAAIAGVMTSTGTNPIWVVKTRLQLSAKKAAPGAAKPESHQALKMTADIIKNEGIRGLYRGLSASYLGVSEGVIQWTLYERFKRIGRTRAVDLEDSKQSLLGYVGSIVGASGGAKAVASLITYPHEVVRTRLRQPAINGVQKYTGLVQTLKLVIKEEGVASLYGGLTAHMFRVVPNAACMFLIYELVAARLGS